MNQIAKKILGVCIIGNAFMAIAMAPEYGHTAPACMPIDHEAGTPSQAPKMALSFICETAAEPGKPTLDKIRWQDAAHRILDGSSEEAFKMLSKQPALLFTLIAARRTKLLESILKKCPTFIDQRVTFPSKCTFLGDTLLHAVAHRPFALKLVRMLLHCGANVNAQNATGQTPLHIAVQNGRNKTACLLLASGANPLLPDCDGETALALVRKSAHIDVGTKARCEHVAQSFIQTPQTA